MLTKLLFNPDASGTAQGTSTETPVAKVETPVVEKPIISGVTMTIAEYEALQAKAKIGESAEAEKLRLEAEAKTAAIAAAKAKGDADEVIRLATEDNQSKLEAERTLRLASESRASSVEQELLAKEVEIVISDALASRNLRGPVQVSQVKYLLRSEVEAKRGPDGKITVTKKGETADATAHLKARLESEDFAPFHAPQTQGGAGSGNTNSGTTTKAASTTDIFSDKPFYIGGRG